jgi:uncharacterized protein (DUF58 family)
MLVSLKKQVATLGAPAMASLVFGIVPAIDNAWAFAAFVLAVAFLCVSRRR